MSATAREQERVLRRLFWQLLFRGRSAHHSAEHGRKKSLALGLQMGLFTLFGVLPALAAWQQDTLSFAASLHTFTFLFAALTLAADAGGMLFQREEAEVLLHRPVAPRTLLRAKVAVLLRFAMLLALALNAAGTITGAWTRDGAPWFAAAHTLSTTLLMLFAASFVVLAYNTCLRWFGRERFDSLMTTLQTLLAIVMVAGAQLWPRLLDTQGLRHVDASGWAAAFPPVWFAALDALLCGTAPLAAVQLPATLGVVATAVVAWLALHKLGNAYGAGLQAMNEAVAGASDRPRRRWLAALVERPPLSWWLRSPAERQAFGLASAYLARDRTTKLRLYPSIAPLLVLPLLWVLGPSSRSAPASAGMVAIGLGYAAMAATGALTHLQRTDQWSAADLFRYAPVPHWTPLFHGARKAVLVWIGFPAVLCVGGLLAATMGDSSPWWPATALLLALPALTLLTGFTKEWLPLSLPAHQTLDASTGCLTLILSLVPATTLAGGALLAHALGYGPYYLAVVAMLSAIAQTTLARRLAKRPWRPERSRR